MSHQRKEQKEQKEQRKVDEAVEATFPASDAPSHGKDVGPDELANFDAVVEKNDKAPKPDEPKR